MAVTINNILDQFGVTASDKFIITVDTTKAGSASDTFILPTSGAGYDCWIDWGEGGAEENKTGTPGNITHVYSSSGTYTIKVSGAFPRIYFSGGGDCLKLMSIENWGNIVWSYFADAFQGCSNMVGNYTDAPILTNVVSFTWTFYGCSSFNGTVNNWDTSTITNTGYMFYGCTSFNQSLSNWDVSSVTTVAGMFYGCTSFNQSFSNWVTTALTIMSAMLRGATAFDQSLANFDVTDVSTMEDLFTDSNALSTANYNAMLISWGAQAVQNTVLFDAGDATYTSGGDAATARAHLVLAVGSGGHGWTINDGGAV